MQKYPVRTSHRGQLNAEAIAGLLRESFGAAELEGTGASTRFGAIERLVVRPDGREVAIDVTMNPKVSNEVAADTIARYNRFLEAATGYTSKERAKRLRKTAGGSASGAAIGGGHRRPGGRPADERTRAASRRGRRVLSGL